MYDGETERDLTRAVYISMTLVPYTATHQDMPTSIARCRWSQIPFFGYSRWQNQLHQPPHLHSLKRCDLYFDESTCGSHIRIAISATTSELYVLPTMAESGVKQIVYGCLHTGENGHHGPNREIYSKLQRHGRCQRQSMWCRQDRNRKGIFVLHTSATDEYRNASNCLWPFCHSLPLHVCDEIAWRGVSLLIFIAQCPIYLQYPVDAWMFSPVVPVSMQILDIFPMCALAEIIGTQVIDSAISGFIRVTET